MVDGSEKPAELAQESFAELFEQSQKQKRRVVRPGDRVSARVVSVGQKSAILDLGDGLDGLMDLAEVAEAGETLRVGQTLEGFVLGIDNRVVMVGRSLGKGAANRRLLEEAATSGVPVEGQIKEVNKGGYVVDVSGVRCFCPLGQIDLHRVEDTASLLGQRLKFRVTEVRAGKDIVLSRRALLEAEQAARAVKTRATLAVGLRVRGRIVNVRDFGAFVDLGGIEGLVPASELAYGRQKPQDVVAVGQDVEVEVMRIEPGKDSKGERIALSMRALAPDPLALACEELPEGTLVRGKVTRLQPYGAFVELLPGVEGLVHISAFGRHVKSVSEVVKEGQDVIVRVDSFRPDERRIQLSFIPDDQLVAALEPGVAVAAPKSKARVLGRAKIKLPPEESAAAAGEPTVVVTKPKVAAPEVGDVVEVTVDKIETFGVFVRWPGGRGLVPVSELGVHSRGTELRRAFAVGTVFRAVITEVRGDGKIRLSKTATEKAEEQAAAEAFMKSQRAPQGAGFGTLGELLKNKRK